jgi:hypothetical protein
LSFSVLNIENKRLELLGVLEDSNSVRVKLIYINDFFEALLKTNNKQIISAYLTEFSEEYLELISSFDPNCINPDLTKKIIFQAKEVSDHLNDTAANIKYTESLPFLEARYAAVKKCMSGESCDLLQPNFYFPLLEELQIPLNSFKLSLLESVSIQIKKSESKNNFNIIPSERELEYKIKEQVENSWRLATDYVKRHIRKISPFHDVVISFDKKWGVVKGDSLGTALTLNFIKELMNYHNSPILLNPPPGTAYTGGMDKNGLLTSVSNPIIKNKVEAVFYSGIKTFAVPKEDEPAAQEMLNELKQKHPERILKIIGVEDFEDLISRRNLVDIRKINPVVRGGKFALKHSLSIILVLALAVVILISGLVDFDDNPATLVYDNQHLKVFNKNKKLLWSEKITDFNDQLFSESNIKKQYAILSDVNGDGKNEVILSNKLFGQKMHDPDYNNIVCYDYAKRIVWKHTFAEVVSTNTITFSSEYRTKFIDTYELNGRKILFVIAKNYYFPSAVFGIDIATGELATEVFWHSGHLDEGLIFKDSSGISDILLLGGVNNGFESASVAVLEISKLAGQTPARSNYNLNNIAPADLLEYILIPPSDYSSFKNSRYNAVIQDHLKFEDKKIRVGINELAGLGEPGSVLFYYFNPDFTINFIETADEFQHQRDKLVKEGKLSPPLTYTAEYFEILKNNIKYWDGDKFVNHLEYFEKNN